MGVVFNNLINMKVLLLIIVISSFTLSNCQTPSQEIVSGNNLFVASVYKEILKKETGNILVSPFSAETVLALTQLGAKDGTASEIRQALHLPNSQEKIVSGFKTLQSSLKNNKNYTLKTANKLYVKKDFEIRDEFKKVAIEGFDSAIENIDFNQKQKAAKTMNTWVEKNTENKIQNLISANSLNELTRLILINALYFKGNWSLPFSSLTTRKQNFHKTAKEIFQVDMMNRAKATYNNYYESPELNAKFLELFFEGQDASMTFILPNQFNGLSSLEKQIDKVFVALKYRKTNVIVALPKFKIEYEIDFIGILTNLGIHKAFDPKEADLSGISGRKGDLVIDEVLQKTFINLNEGGVEAAAATFVEVATLSAPLDPEPTFIADHPFIFYIKVKDLIIFAGRVVSPKV